MTTVESSPSSELVLRHITIRAEWLNSTGHMRAAQYVVLFEEAFDQFRTDSLCRGSRAGAAAPFLLEMHTCYLKELVAGDVIAITAQLLGFDSRRLHLILVMRHDKALTAATTELSIVNFNLAARKSEPWEASQMQTLERLNRIHATVPKAIQVGRAITPVVSTWT